MKKHKRAKPRRRAKCRSIFGRSFLVNGKPIGIQATP